MASPKTIKVKEFRKVLVYLGLEHKATKGSHESWGKKGMARPVVFPNSKKELKVGTFKSNLRTLKITFEQYQDIVEEL